VSKSNSVRLIGHLGQSPEVKSTSDSNIVVSFSMGTHEHYSDKEGNKVKTTDWHNVVAFGKVGALCQQYLKQGSHVMVEGKLKTRSYQNKEGQTRYSTEVILEDILFLGSKDSKQGSTNQENM